MNLQNSRHLEKNEDGEFTSRNSRHLGKKMMLNVHRVDDDVASVWCAVSIFCGNRTWSVMISAVAIVQQYNEMSIPNLDVFLSISCGYTN